MFEIFRWKGGPHEGLLGWCFRLPGTNGRVLLESVQGHTKRSAVLADIKRMKDLVGNAPVHEVL